MQTLGFMHQVTDLKEYFPYRPELFHASLRVLEREG